ncbi:YceI family protein [Pseudoxanthomonas sp. SL93]|jgi:polyisoprenoid-binding protein YceI|uniref:YceI family protein n=1 Tax=Pseudoxanthomonas sp. SL93 TaxID=2995142 RepID=UPI00226FCCB3|nr:YceI family protein [Pseudoxanthomonas sp. SL93]WAC62538.1 YceI family protein [Pseudoxanthomonas sp. SL93]
MTPGSPLVRLGALGLGLLAAWPLQASEKSDFDPAHTRLGFELRTRWGQVLDGVFKRYEGDVTRLPDGRHQVRLRMYTRDVEILGHPRYSEWARSEKFFDADRYPVVVFTSKPYDERLLREGGKLEGDLSIKGINRARSLDVAPSTCDRPARDCDVLATGAVRRSDYDMDDWMVAVSDRVVFVLRARVRDGAQP